MNIQEVILLSADYLESKGIDQARLQAEHLVATMLGMKRLDLYMNFDRPVNEEELAACREALKRRGQGEPLCYIEGTVDFYGCTFEVNPHVLIPRPETEILVDKIVSKCKKIALKGKKLWDICSGSGCIGISLKKEFPDLDVTLVDISDEAIQVAKMNAQKNDVEVETLCGDLFAPLHNQQADFIVCNPPYISKKEFNELSSEVKNWEPHQALLAGDTGLEFYSKIAEEIKKYLKPGGYAWFELGAGQGNAVYELFKRHQLNSLCVEKDWAGHDRFFSLENE